MRAAHLIIASALLCGTPLVAQQDLSKVEIKAVTLEIGRASCRERVLMPV